ncbi:hypothetical protein [Sphingobacterium siyangense]|uniref:Uncharacterized protein n=1 Tax=Sphingobacterium siyangense TaxID=459529 RepID=A0A562MQY7_9SPHI|nr:hypothetical protein [Sphingobacterium siyangense]TWI22208.1 hypothetical protein IQ31_01613 [Sphingobacterium siyangense]
MDRIFAVDFKKVILNFLPKFFRRKRIFALIDAFTSGLRTVYLLFLSKRNDDNKELQITPQVCILRRVLNDYFDGSNRTIRIEDANLHERSYIFTEGEQRPLFLGERAIYTADELRSGTGFVVIVPEALNNTAETARLKAMINKYKLAGTKYIIRYE